MRAFYRQGEGVLIQNASRLLSGSGVVGLGSAFGGHLV
jgi:hypothetical protein